MADSFNTFTHEFSFNPTIVKISAYKYMSCTVPVESLEMSTNEVSECVEYNVPLHT